MNKLLISLVLLVSCQDTKREETVVSNNSYTASKFTIYNFKYNGHDYIEFFNGPASWGTHDPDCLKCKK